MYRRAYIMLLGVVGACGFDVRVNTDGGMGSGDGSGSADAMAAICPWPYTPEYANPCPATDGPEIDLTEGDLVLDTDDGTLTGGPTSIDIVSEITADVRVVWTRGFHIGPDATLRVIGSFPAVFIATGSITIEGTLDAAGRASSPLTGDNPAGANPAECGEPTVGGAGPGQPCAAEGASGGGGGSFATMGGQGGGGGSGRNCGQVTGPLPGGTGGAIVAMRPLTLRGGCPGAAGGLSTQAGAIAGRAGSGGGAVALVGRDQVTISGRVNVGGAGGGGAVERSGGGGGGSGGMIVLEGTTITITTQARVSANGGGGGGGCDNNSADEGDDGKDGVAVAQGGANEGSGTDGGDGAARSNGAVSADVSGRGGGGGGGGVGYVRFHSRDGVTAPSEPTSVSPVGSP
ncbi:MAG: hypothetical protein ACKV2T_40945 [Kofleriaceae bacterium]